uniref:Centrosomal protein of 162 kDa n=1 Tax=Heterorhabditis bacteriophora TaxID=37862 RepID=A0A1I7XKM0_HETBA
MEATDRNGRGRSVELDGRRINAVSPMHLGESKMLHSLWKEHQQQQHQSVVNSGELNSSKEDDSERKLKMMLEKYQNQVKLQQRFPQPLQSKAPPKNNVQKVESFATSQQSVSNYSTRGLSGSCSADQQEGQLGVNGNQRMPNNQKLIQSLREENLYLKRENDTTKKKLMKLQQIESAYERIEKDYETLLRDKERQESLEKSALVQMEIHLKRIMSEKESLQDRLDHIILPNMQAMEKIGQLNMVLAEIIPQNKELMAVKERQKMELDAQNATLEEQRTHIAMLEKALSNAQERLSKREKVFLKLNNWEDKSYKFIDHLMFLNHLIAYSLICIIFQICEELSAAAERANHLQRLLHDTLLDKQTRDEAHAHERTQWEIETTQLKMQLNKDSSQNGSLKRLIGGRLSLDTGDETISGLRRTMLCKDERITQLERTIVDLQSKVSLIIEHMLFYLLTVRKLHDETERKKCALDALSEDLESKIKRLEDEKLEKTIVCRIQLNINVFLLMLLKDHRIAVLTGEREKLGNLLEVGKEQEGESALGMQRMEEIRQKIQERKRKGRIGATGG